MRRKDREITGRENIEPILKACKVCRIGMIADGWPYVIPMNYGYEWDDTGLTLYFHSGVKGKKLDALRADPHICFEMDLEDGLTGEGDNACRYSYAFSSVVGYGSMEFAQDSAQKRHGFDVIMRHQTGRGGWTYTEPALSVAEVFWVHADSFEASRKTRKPQE
ncbi:MAG: pyridoxamine 5'-phosphate oxidase family protein [Agathobaculum sp.]|jgi:nitroimidazol reductase NimA-like FMN-containing flavoprotein (pyridoxamine 5'-phosphate oxidase superfamily)|uniref:pyridoxamine 5'-phosphate oxidase family protein n=1 Tax=Agathobaculum sp. TaxID=2048138 RepID=UPI003D8E19B7